MFFDFYYAYTDNSCINQNINKLYINMHDYLIISAYNTLAILILLIFGIFFYDDKNKIYIVIYSIFYILIYINAIFVTSWNIIGNIIFWSMMDTNSCSKEIYNYLGATLIIKFIYSFILIINNSKK